MSSQSLNSYLKKKFVVDYLNTSQNYMKNKHLKNLQVKTDLKIDKY